MDCLNKSTTGSCNHTSSMQRAVLLPDLCREHLSEDRSKQMKYRSPPRYLILGSPGLLDWLKWFLMLTPHFPSRISRLYSNSPFSRPFILNSRHQFLLHNLTHPIRNHKHPLILTFTNLAMFEQNGPPAVESNAIAEDRPGQVGIPKKIDAKLVSPQWNVAQSKQSDRSCAYVC